jgi:DNA (cytosine-5)-methyltransferase 1
MPSNKLGLISLFCGPGGFDIGFAQAGFSTILAYDIDKASINTYRHNHRRVMAEIADLSTIATDDIIAAWKRQSRRLPVGVIGGPPCQSFSNGNRNQTSTDKRHHLPEHYARILRDLNGHFGLDFFVFENVPGLINKKHIARFGRFKAMFREAGFKVFEASLDAKHFGVPQTRPRVFVVGLNQDKYPELEYIFPKGDPTCNRTVGDAIRNLPEPVHFRRGLTPKDIPYHHNHWCMAPKSHKFKNGWLKPGKYIGRSFRLLDWNKPSYTLAYGHREVHVHPDGTRRLSVLEAMLLQAFPKKYELVGTLSDQIRMVSEAVSPPVARAIANSIKQQLDLDGAQRRRRR